MLPDELLLSADDSGVVVTAGLRWLDCDEYPVLSVETACLLPEDEPLSEVPWTAVPVLRTAVFSLRIDGVVLTTEDLLVVDPVLAAVLPEASVRDDVPPEACTLLTVLLPEVFLLTVLLVPMPPLSEDPLENTRSEPV